MGFTIAKVKILGSNGQSKSLDFLVDTGAFYSVVPKEILKEIGIKPRGKKEFTLANGQKIKRLVGGAVFCYRNFEGISPVIFGEKKDKALLGVLTIEAMGLEVDPIKKQLKPTELLLLLL